MPKQRRLMFYIWDKDVTGKAKVGGLPITSALDEGVQAALGVVYMTKGKIPKPDEYDLYDWQPQSLSHAMTLGEVPRPGIVIAIGKSHQAPDKLAIAFTVKMGAEQTPHPRFRREFDTWMQGEESKFEPVAPTLHDVFLSYASPDAGVASEIRDSLLGKGIKCFMSEKDIKSGVLWEKKIRDAIKGARLAIVLLTPESLHSKWVMCEAGAFWVLEKPLIPALMNVKKDDLPEPIGKHQAVSIETIAGRDNLYADVISFCASS